MPNHEWKMVSQNFTMKKSKLALHKKRLSCSHTIKSFSIRCSRYMHLYVGMKAWNSKKVSRGYFVQHLQYYCNFPRQTCVKILGAVKLGTPPKRNGYRSYGFSIKTSAAISSEINDENLQNLSSNFSWFLKILVLRIINQSASQHV